jgi:hypothetical protein
MLHAIRASLLARAVASLLRCSRGAAFRSHAPKLKRSQLWGRIRITFAAWMNRVLRYLLPRLEMRPRMDRPPVLYWRGTRPSHAPKSRPRSNASPVPMAATTAVEISGPIPGTLVRRRQLASLSPICSISPARPPCLRLCPVYPGNPRCNIEGESPHFVERTYSLAVIQHRLARICEEAVRRAQASPRLSGDDTL